MQTNFFTKNIVSRKLALKYWLILSCCFSCLLLFVRIAATGLLTYTFLVWNLFLAFIPFLISEGMFKGIPAKQNKLKLAAFVFAWLLFIPNSFYIVTDMFHLDQFDSAPKWFDLLLLFSFAWNGLLLGILSLRTMEMYFQKKTAKEISLMFVFTVMWLNAFGIYIGRYLRFNSWDIITQPFSLFGEMIELIIHPFQNKMEWGMITVWAVFMTLFYMTIKMMKESFSQKH